ncbi:MAG: hypothetical protein OXC02_04910, partial [Rhodobacteraceae bacterium]|nr:hypothetical protein [Paracoccaceae bacterium]
MINNNLFQLRSTANNKQRNLSGTSFEKIFIPYFQFNRLNRVYLMTSRYFGLLSVLFLLVSWSVFL